MEVTSSQGGELDHTSSFFNDVYTKKKITSMSITFLLSSSIFVKDRADVFLGRRDADAGDEIAL